MNIKNTTIHFDIQNLTELIIMIIIDYMRDIEYKLCYILNYIYIYIFFI